jgi:hypothetical protein
VEGDENEIGIYGKISTPFNENDFPYGAENLQALTFLLFYIASFS